MREMLQKIRNNFKALATCYVSVVLIIGMGYATYEGTALSAVAACYVDEVLPYKM